MIKNVLMLILLISCSDPQQAKSVSDFGFGMSSPEAEGFNGYELDSIHNEILAGDYGLMDHFLVIRNGNIVFDRSYKQDYKTISTKYDTTNFQYNYDHPNWHPYYNGTELHTMQSVTKSITSIVFGIAMDQEAIADLSTPAMQEFFRSDFDQLDEMKKSMSYQDILTMRAGFQWDEANYNNSDNDCIVMELKDDWISYVINKPMSETPGTRFNYNSGASVLLGKIVRNRTGQRIDEFADRALFKPLGIDKFHWKMTNLGEIDTEGGLYLKPMDLAKIGYLFLNNGMWGKERIVSEEWVKESIFPHVEHVNPENDNSPGYGYQWWIYDYDEEGTKIFAGNGYGGQFLFVVPRKNLIVVLNGWNIHDRPKKSSFNILRNRILPTLKK